MKKNNTAKTVTTQNATIIRKTEGKSLSGRAGIELVFDKARKLSDSEVKTIKAMGFRWSRNQQLWYAGYTDELFAKATKRFGAVAETASAPKAKAPAKKAETKVVKGKPAAKDKAQNGTRTKAQAKPKAEPSDISQLAAMIAEFKTAVTLEVAELKSEFAALAASR